MCKSDCAVWGVESDKPCPDCLLNMADAWGANSRRQLLLADALARAVSLCPPFGFLVRELRGLMDTGVSAAEVIDWIRSQRKFYPPCSYEGGVEHSFRLGPQFVEVSK